MIVLGMAGIAIGGRAFEDIIGVAAGTSRLDVGAGQFKGSRIVIEGCRQPGSGRVA